MRRTCLPAAPIKAPCTMFRNTTPKPLPNNTENNTMTDGQNKDLQWILLQHHIHCSLPKECSNGDKKKCNQGCTVPNLCSWATRKSYNVLFSYKSYAGHPGFNKFRALGSLQFFLEHSWGLQKHDKLTSFFLHISVTFPLPKSLFIFPSIC